MARRICQLYDTFATGTGNDRISRISVLQTLCFSANAFALSWLLSVCHKVTIEDVARVTGHPPGRCTRQHLRHIYNSRRRRTAVICSAGHLSAAEDDGTVPLYCRGYLCYTFLARWKGTIVLYYIGLQLQLFIATFAYLFA